MAVKKGGIMRPIWSGAITFGLLNVPVRLLSAVEERTLDFNLLHKKDHGHIRYAKICEIEQKEVPYEEIVKGYEIEKDRYVIITDEDFKKAEQAEKERAGSIDILHFTDDDQIDSIYFDKPYYLEPGKGADKAYVLLLETLRESKKVAVCKYVIRNRERLGILKPYDKIIVLNQMRFASEIRSIEDLKVPKKAEVSKKDLAISLKLVEQLSEDFNPENYHDTYLETLKKVIKAKAKGSPVKAKSTQEKPSKVHDISALLKASLEETKHKTRKKA